MSDTESTKNVAEELRGAAKVLRCDHAFPCYPPTGTSRQPGPCRHCGLPRLVVADEVPEKLREPLAVWLEEFADWASRSIEPREWDEADEVMVHESEYCNGEIGKNCRCFDRALAVARVLNGTAPQEVVVR